MKKRSCEYCKYLPAYGEGAYCRLMDRPIESSILFERGCQHFEELKQTVFEKITESPEVLAPCFIEKQLDKWDDDDYPYYSFLTKEWYATEAEAITATVARLKEICDE